MEGKGKKWKEGWGGGGGGGIKEDEKAEEREVRGRSIKGRGGIGQTMSIFHFLSIPAGQMMDDLPTILTHQPSMEAA